METEHAEGVVERAVAFVKNALSPTPRVESNTVEDLPFGPPEPGVIANDPAFVRPTVESRKSGVELNAESARREDGLD